MATTRNQTAATVETQTEPDVPEAPTIPENIKGREYDPRKLVYVYESETGKKLDRPVPETWLDGRFPQLSETPSKKAGK